VAGHQTLCGACWKNIRFISKPYCACCGAPFDIPVDEGALCAACLDRPPDYAKARSAMIYDDASKNLVLGFKHGDRLHAVPALATWMQQAGKDLIDETSVIIPVPLHWWRLFTRRYNQAALLAQALSRGTGKPIAVDALKRIRATAPQGKMKRDERRKNVKNAFRLNPRYEQRVENKNILLIDDVLTSGATAGECARILRAAGAAKVSVLTLMRAQGPAK